MRTLLVTGGAGFIGSCLVRLLVGSGARVVNLDKLTYAGHRASLAELDSDPRHVFVQGDIGDAPLVSHLLKKYQPDAVLNLAAETHVDRSIDGPAAFVKTNVVGTFRLLETTLDYWRSLAGAERDRFRLLHVSTDEVFGSLGPEGAFRETTPYAPNSPYSASKAAADHFVRAFHHTYGLPTLVTNCSNNYGPRQFPEKLLPLMIANCVAGKPLPVYGDGQQVRDWLFVEDHCRGLIDVLDRGRSGESYNLGGACERTNLSVVETLCDLIDELFPNLPHRPCRGLIKFVADRPGHDRRYAIDATKIRSELGWQPATTFEQGLRQTVEWYLANGDWIQTVTRGKYQQERLGLNLQTAKAHA